MAVCENINVDRKSAFDCPVIVSGMRSSGKSLLLGLLQAFSDEPSTFKDFRIGHICQLDYWSLISREVSVPMLRYAVDFNFYDLCIGRGLNFRIGDETSIWSSPKPGAAVQLIKRSKGENVFESKDRLVVFDIHNALVHLDLLSSTFSKAKVINVSRSPISIIYSWVRDKLFDDDQLQKRTCQMLVSTHKGIPVPLIAHSWREEYVKMTLKDRSVKIFKALSECEEVQRSNFNLKKGCVLDLNYESILSAPDTAVDALEDFLGLKSKEFLNKVFEKERVPRVICERESLLKKDSVFAGLSRENKSYLANLSNGFMI